MVRRTESLARRASRFVPYASYSESAGLRILHLMCSGAWKIGPSAGGSVKVICLNTRIKSCVVYFVNSIHIAQMSTLGQDGDESVW